ncbi:MAG: Permease of the major facilitator superfamily protein [Proteobacteria bacterium]|nr:Permease of the major facilitator superfamily protein [Pseudomonadota bacterium]
MRKRFADPMFQGLAVAALALLMALASVSWLTVVSSSRLLFPELAQTALAEASQGQGKIDAALDLGIPLDRVVGVDWLFASMKESDPDIAFLAITDGGKVLFSEGVTAATLVRLLASPPEPASAGLSSQQSLKDGHLVTELPLRSGAIHLGHHSDALFKPLADNLVDVGVIVLVSCLLAFEVMLLVVVLNVVQPARAVADALRVIAGGGAAALVDPRASGWVRALAVRLVRLLGTSSGGVKASPRSAPLVSVRLLAFLFVFAEELGRSFMPVYAGDIAAATSGLDANFATGVVVGLHMCMVAVAMPFATLLYTRLGRARLYAAGALIATAGLVGTGLADNYWSLLAWRAVSAFGYGATYVACQGFVIENTTSANRASGSAMMVGGITLADICGPAFGGVLAERFGQSETFIFAALVAALSAVVVAWLMAGSRRSPGERPRNVTLGDFAIALANRRLAVQVIFAAIPAKLLLTGFLYYLLPVTLIGDGWREADVGRILMVYGAVVLLGGPLLSRLTDRRQNHAVVVTLGLILSALPLLAAPLVPEALVLPAAIVMVAALGSGQAMSITAQTSMVVGMASEADVRHGHAPELTVMRFVERFGGGLGPMIAAPLGAHFGSVGAIAVFGVYACLSAMIYAGLTARWRASPSEVPR